MGSGLPGRTGGRRSFEAEKEEVEDDESDASPASPMSSAPKRRDPRRPPSSGRGRGCNRGHGRTRSRGQSRVAREEDAPEETEMLSSSGGPSKGRGGKVFPEEEFEEDKNDMEEAWGEEGSYSEAMHGARGSPELNQEQCDERRSFTDRGDDGGGVMEGDVGEDGGDEESGHGSPTAPNGSMYRKTSSSPSPEEGRISQEGFVQGNSGDRSRSESVGRAGAVGGSVLLGVPVPVGTAVDTGISKSRRLADEKEAAGLRAAARALRPDLSAVHAGTGGVSGAAMGSGKAKQSRRGADVGSIRSMVQKVGSHKNASEGGKGRRRGGSASEVLEGLKSDEMRDSASMCGLDSEPNEKMMAMLVPTHSPGQVPVLEDLAKRPTEFSSKSSLEDSRKGANSSHDDIHSAGKGSGGSPPLRPITPPHGRTVTGGAVSDVESNITSVVSSPRPDSVPPNRAVSSSSFDGDSSSHGRSLKDEQRRTGVPAAAEKV
ncbi:unnamed protein product [Choristocarpus tenellus]